MKAELSAVLRNLSTVDFIELRHALGIAGQVRDLMKDFNVSVAEMGMHLNISEEEVIDIRMGAYNVDLRLISKIQSTHELLEVERLKEQVSNIYNSQFKPDYKYTPPIQSTEPENEKQ